jgi:hypothetical protein
MVESNKFLTQTGNLNPVKSNFGGFHYRIGNTTNFVAK